MLFNTSNTFVGIEKLKLVHREQVLEFESWAAQNDWEKFHYSHYDWWTFPINRPSSFGYAWVVYEGEVDLLKSDLQFMSNYRRGVVLVSASWGWNLESCTYICHPLPGQSWHHWPIRLYKAAQSVQLFGLGDYFASLRALALDLIGKEESFLYNGRDLSSLFL